MSFLIRRLHKKNDEDKKPVFLESVKFMTKIIGLDLVDEESTWDIVKFSILWSNFLILMYLQFVSIIMIEDFSVKVECISTTITILYANLKMIGVRLNIRQAREMYRTLDQLISDPEPDDLPVLKTCGRRVHIVIVTFAMLDYITAIFGMVVPAIIHNISNRNNIHEMILPFRGWFPYDMFQSPLVFGLTCAWECLTTLDAAYLVAMFRGLFCSSALIVSTQISVLIIHLKKLDPKKEGHREELKKLVARHNVVLGVVERFNNLFAYAHLTEVVLAAILFCLELFQLTRASDGDSRLAMYAPFVIGAMISVFMICFCGELLKSKSEQLMEAVYEVPWYEMNRKERLDFLFILRQSQRILTFNVKGRFVMDMVLFLGTMQSTYTYMTILTSMEK